jgi:hypothetical protein
MTSSWHRPRSGSMAGEWSSARQDRPGAADEALVRGQDQVWVLA